MRLCHKLCDMRSFYALHHLMWEFFLLQFLFQFSHHHMLKVSAWKIFYSIFSSPFSSSSQRWRSTSASSSTVFNIHTYFFNKRGIISSWWLFTFWLRVYSLNANLKLLWMDDQAGVLYATEKRWIIWWASRHEGDE